MDQEIFVGIDVCKAWLDVAQAPGTAPAKANNSSAPPALAARVNNDECGHAALVAQLKRLGATLVVMEATGGLETAWPVRCVWPA